MRKLALAVAAASFLSFAGASFAAAGYKGPHPVKQLRGNEYAIVVTPATGGKSLVIYRAVGSSWERLGGTIVEAGQHRSNGTLYQDIWFNGKQVRTVTGDLRLPFYRLYPNHGTIDY